MIKRLGRSFSRRASVALLLCLLLHASTFSQDSLVAIPPNEVSRYRIDFARNFYASAEAEMEDRAQLYATLNELETMKGKVAASAGNLERALQLNDRSQAQLRRHSAYLYLRNAVNTSDEISLAEDSKLNADVSSRTAFLRQELMQLDKRQLAAFTSRRPSLKRYLFAIESVRRYRPYTLSPENERLSAAAIGDEWQSELYDKLRVQPQAIPAQRDLFAFALARLAAARTRIAELRHFADAPSAAYFDSYWTRAEVDELMEEVARQSALYKRYQRLHADYLKRTANKNWPPPRYTIHQASEIIRQALLPLGQEYGRELAALLDPANGRMDIVPGEHRKRGGFSKGFVGTKRVFLHWG